MYSSLRLIVLFSFIANFTYAEANEHQPFIEEEDKELTHIGVHYATYFASAVCLATSVIAGMQLAESLSEKGVARWVCSSSQLLTVMMGCFIYYKTPQWTDTYLLGIKEQRSTAANIIVSFCRLFLPFGCLIGEDLANTSRKKREERKRIIALMNEIERAQVNLQPVAAEMECV